MTLGSLVLVGAGPGDPELLTLKAVRVLKSADVVLYDNLVSDEILKFIPDHALQIHVGKRGGKPSCKQSEICDIAIAYALEGKRVIRLKGGDPMIFGRADEELRAAQAANIPVEIVSGVTAAFGAAASLQLSLTKRGVARKLQFVTAHARGGKLPTDLDFAALVDKTATTCIYMGVKTLPPLVASLQAFGMSGDTPIIIVENATCETENIIHGTLDTILDNTAYTKLDGPCLIILGEAMRKHILCPLK